MTDFDDQLYFKPKKLVTYPISTDIKFSTIIRSGANLKIKNIDIVKIETTHTAFFQILTTSHIGTNFFLQFDLTIPFLSTYVCLNFIINFFLDYCLCTDT